MTQFLVVGVTVQEVAVIPLSVVDPGDILIRRPVHTRHKDRKCEQCILKLTGDVEAMSYRRSNLNQSLEDAKIQQIDKFYSACCDRIRKAQALINLGMRSIAGPRTLQSTYNEAMPRKLISYCSGINPVTIRLTLSHLWSRWNSFPSAETTNIAPKGAPTNGCMDNVSLPTLTFLWELVSHVSTKFRYLHDPEFSP
jgi:hypothetical protein